MQGGCHCGQIRYRVEGKALTSSICHCTDCRRCSGAPMVAWAMFLQLQVVVTQGTPRTYASSEHGRRQNCPTCGTGLFYENAVTLPGIIDIQTSTLDDPEALPPRVQVQLAERLHWSEGIATLPGFPRYPAMAP
ncbi:MAG: GFA family protein [Tabrizicola sp.]|nr:GFA family protein [Tabrizicola sp.]